MSKYLFVTGGSFGADYAAVSFEQKFKGSRLGLWTVANAAGKELDYENGELAFGYEALEMDDDTVDQIQSRMDYDDSKFENYYKVEEA